MMKLHAIPAGLLFSASVLGVAAFGSACGGSTAIGVDAGDGAAATDASDARGSGTGSRSGRGSDAGSGKGTRTGSGAADATVDAPLEAAADAGDAATEASSGTGSGSDAGMEAGSGTGSGSGSSPPSCTGSETACGFQALCVAGTCTPCNDPADDGNCTSAYGSAQNPAYVCDAAGACVPGDCHSDSNCTAGQICGVTQANFCSGCTTDAECQADPTYGPSTVCDTTTSTCISSRCGAADQICSANASDFCCQASPPATGNSCLPGGCCTNGDCTGNPNGSICVNNVCGPCTTDSQCAAGQICGTNGGCIAQVCAASTDGVPNACSGSKDVCCAVNTCFTPPAGAIACCPGQAGDEYCQAPQQLNDVDAICSPATGTCTTCSPVATTDPVYLVDPVNGNDGATGSGAPTPNCALKSVTRAIQLANAADPDHVQPTTITIVGGVGVTVGAAETFPLRLPANTTLDTSTGPVSIAVPKAQGVVLGFAGSVVTGTTGAALTITGGNSATTGVLVDGTATSGSTRIAALTVMDFKGGGIEVTAGSVAIGAGVTSENNTDGLHVTDTGSAVLDNPVGSAPIVFTGNQAHGILVDTQGSITLTGVVTSPSAGTGTITCNGNQAAGLYIAQTQPSAATALPPNVVDGVVANMNIAGNGMRIVAPSAVTVTNSAFLGNNGNGVIVSAGGNGAVNANDVSQVDLGTSGAAGANVFQASLGAGSNKGAGICLATAPDGSTLNAAGNTFVEGACTGGNASALTINPKGCGFNAHDCPTGACDLGLAGQGGTPNAFNVASCTQ